MLALQTILALGIMCFSYKRAVLSRKGGHAVG